MRIDRFHTPGLGDNSYLLVHAGRGVVVDPQRDIDRVVQAAAEADAALRAVVETHLHNDYVSGAPALAARSGAELVLPAAAGAAYQHRPAFHDEELDLGAGLMLRPLHTPGHTPEHTSYVVLVDGEPEAVFTGGSLLVAAAGRTDLLGEARSRQLARLQHGSLQRLAELPAHVQVCPTHGEGSFCTTSGAARATSDVATELATNPAMGHAGPEAFADWQRGQLQPYPDYYGRISTANLEGRGPLRSAAPAALSAEEVEALAGRAQLVDLRDRHVAVTGFVPGSHLIALGDDFGVWAGWVLDLDAPVVLVADQADGDDVAEAVVQLARVGIDDVRGVLPTPAWTEAGGEPASLKTATAAQVAAAPESEPARGVLDVRSPGEVAEGSLPTAVHRYVPDLRGDAARWLPVSEEPYVLCGSGRRTTIAAGLLARRGYRPVPLVDGGIQDVLAARTGA